jgi:hypothetical protein
MIEQIKNFLKDLPCHYSSAVDRRIRCPKARRVFHWSHTGAYSAYFAGIFFHVEVLHVVMAGALLALVLFMAIVGVE